MESPKLPLARRLTPWLPAIAWAILISWASTDMFSASHTSQFIIAALHGLFPRASAETLDRLHFFIRKSAHFTEYFALVFFCCARYAGKIEAGNSAGRSSRWRSRRDIRRSMNSTSHLCRAALPRPGTRYWIRQERRPRRFCYGFGSGFMPGSLSMPWRKSPRRSGIRLRFSRKIRLWNRV